MSSVASPAGLIHLGMDTARNTIVVATLMTGEENPMTDRIVNEEEADAGRWRRAGASVERESCLKRSPASLAKRNIGQLAALVKIRLKRMQYRPSLIGGFLANTRLDLTPFW